MQNHTILYVVYMSNFFAVSKSNPKQPKKGEWTNEHNMQMQHTKNTEKTHISALCLSPSSTSVYQIAVCAHTINHITFRILKIGKILMHVAEIPFAHFIVEPKNYNLWNATTTPKRNKTISIHFAAFMPLPCAFR